MTSILQDISLLLSMAPLGFFFKGCCCGEPPFDLFNVSGFAFLGAGFGYTSSVYGFNSATQEWAIKQDIPSPARQAFGASQHGGIGYAICGTSATGELSDNDAYDPDADSWTSKTSITSPTRLAPGQGTGTDDIGVFGGFHQSGGPTGYNTLDQIDLYDPTGDSWSTSGNTSGTDRMSLASTEIGNYLYFFGGFSNPLKQQFTGSRVNDADEYDIAGDAFNTLANTPLPRRSWVGGAAVDSLAYMIGGSSSDISGQYTAVTDCDEYDPVGDSWTSKSNMLDTRCFNSVTETPYDNTIHSFGGQHLTTFASKSHLIYTPDTDTQSTGPSLIGNAVTSANSFGFST